jgi:bacterioferritin (cytochrome b1)
MNTQPLIQLSPREILAGLEAALLAEQQAVADYAAHARGSKSPDMAEALEALRDVEEEHARRLASRIVALGGSPARQPLQPQPAGETLADWLEHDLRGEQWAIVEYARLVASILDDEQTAEMMTELLVDELRHARWLKAALRTHAAAPVE